MHAVIITAALLSLTAAQPPSIPSSPPGYEYLYSQQPKVVIEVFYDHLCSDSKANWPVLKNVFMSYTEKAVRGLIHIFPLPYHHNAFFMQQAGETVRNLTSAGFEDFLDLAFLNQDEFLSEAVNLTEPQVKTKISKLVAGHMKITTDQMDRGFTDPLIMQRSRFAWKYACSRGTTGTPQFLINGVHVPSAPDFNVDDWKQFLDSLLSQP